MTSNPLITRHTILRTQEKQQLDSNQISTSEPIWSRDFFKAYAQAVSRDVNVTVADIDEKRINFKKLDGSLRSDQIKDLFKGFHLKTELPEYFNRYTLTSIFSIWKTCLTSTIAELVAEDSNTAISGTKWISAVGLNYEVFKQLVIQLNLNSLAIKTMFSNNHCLPEYYGNQLLIEIPHYSLLHDEQGIAPCIKTTWLYGEIVSDPNDWLQNKLASGLQILADGLFDCFTLSPLSYACSKVLTYGENNEYYNSQFSLLQASNPIYSHKLKIIEGKTSIVIFHNNVFFTYSNFFEDHLDNEFVLRCLTDPEFEFIVGNSFSSSDYVLLIAKRKIKMAQESYTAFCEILTKLEIDILNNPSIKIVRQLKSLSREFERFKLHVKSLKLMLKNLIHFRIFTKEKTLSLLYNYQQDIDCCLSSIDNLILRSSDLTTQLFNIMLFQDASFAVKSTVVTMFIGIMSWWASYFGMNFNTFTQATTHDVRYFWEFSLPITVCAMFIIMWRQVFSKVKETVHYVTTGFSNLGEVEFVELKKDVKTKLTSDLKIHGIYNTRFFNAMRNLKVTVCNAGRAFI